MRSVLILERFHPEALVRLQTEKSLRVLDRSSTVPSAGELAEAHALVIRSRSQISREFLAACPNLQLLITTTAGFDHIDLNATQALGITVMHTPSAHRESAAELTLALMLATARKLNQAEKVIRAGKEWTREPLQGDVLFRKTLGLIGLGRIGSRVSELAQAFRMNVLAFDPYQEASVFEKYDVTRVSWEECLKSSHFLSFHVPATTETRHMLSRASLEFTHRGAVIVNTSRGSVIKEEDLVHALEQNWISACGLDVFEKEPLPRTSKLLLFPQVVLSAHGGANTEQAFRECGFETIRKLLAFFERGETSDTLPPQAEWYQSQGSFRAALS